MKKLNLEVVVGLFVLAGMICLGYLSIRLGKQQIFGSRGYELHAHFSNVGGLKAGADVVIAGVTVGRVKEIGLEDYRARVVLDLDHAAKVPDDAMASIRTKGLIGEKYIEIAPGASEDILVAGDRIRETQPAINLEDLISKIVFDGTSKGEK